MSIPKRSEPFLEPGVERSRVNGKEGSDLLRTELAMRLPKLKFDSYLTTKQMSSLVDWLSQLGDRVEPVQNIAACRMADDIKLLAVALSGAAD